MYVQLIEKTRFNKVKIPDRRYHYKVTRIPTPLKVRNKVYIIDGRKFSAMYDYKVEEVDGSLALPSFRGLGSLAFRGLGSLAFRGLGSLAFSVGIATIVSLWGMQSRGICQEQSQ